MRMIHENTVTHNCQANIQRTSRSVLVRYRLSRFSAPVDWRVKLSGILYDRQLNVV